MKTGGPPRGRDPTLKISRVAQTGVSNVLKEKPEYTFVRLPTDGIKLRSTKVCSSENLLIHMQLVVTWGHAVATNYLRGFHLMMGIHILEEHWNRFTGIEKNAQVLGQEAGDKWADFALQFADTHRLIS